MATNTLLWTFLPGLHGTAELYEAVKNQLPPEIHAEFIELPLSGRQDYDYLLEWLDNQLTHGSKRLIIAESFSGPLALRFAEKRPDEVIGIVLAASFCDAPLHPSIALLPLRPLFMVKPARKALRHFLIGDDASEADLAALIAAVARTSSATITSRVRAILELTENDAPTLWDKPMLILQAQSDQLIPWEAQRKLEAHYPNASVHWIESPHLIFQRASKECLQCILEFVHELEFA